MSQEIGRLSRRRIGATLALIIAGVAAFAVYKLRNGRACRVGPPRGEAEGTAEFYRAIQRGSPGDAGEARDTRGWWSGFIQSRDCRTYLGHVCAENLVQARLLATASAGEHGVNVGDLTIVNVVSAAPDAQCVAGEVGHQEWY
jgi:hypothetical protein